MKSIRLWISNFVGSKVVKAEALISGNLWSYVFRRIILALETGSRSQNDSDIQIECFNEYNTDNIEAIGTRFYTDLVYLAGSSGLPLMMVEMAAESRKYNNEFCR